MKITLPKWLPITDIKKLITILSIQGGSRLVGGCVREVLTGNHTDDIDIATQVNPYIALELLSSANIKCIPTGIKHGTITAIIGDNSFQITTLRMDIESYGRHAKVEFTSEWKEDAKRRDFTINAMYLDLSGNLYDYFNGYDDLKNKIVKFVGNPVDRINEDYLRILRYFRFYSYFGSDNIDLKSLHACAELAGNISKLSGERIQREIFKMLTAKFAIKAMSLMSKYNVWQQVFHFNLPTQVENLIIAADPVVNLAAILKLAGANEQNIRNIARELRFSNSDLHELLLLCFTMEYSPSEIDRILYYHGSLYGKKYIEMNRVLGVEIAPGIENKIQSWKAPKLPITGHDIQALGFTGKEIGAMLELLERKWVDSKFLLTKEELLNELKTKHRH